MQLKCKISFILSMIVQHKYNIITLFARCNKFPELADPPVCSRCCIRTEFGSGLRSLAPLSNSQLSCLPPDNAPNINSLIKNNFY